MADPLERLPPDLERLMTHEQFARQVARGLLHDEHLAEDAVQDAWLAAIRRPPATDRATRAWLGTVTRNFSYQVARARIRRRERERKAAREEAVAKDDPALDASDQRRIGTAVIALREPYREAVLLRFYEGLAPRAIASRLALPVETVKTRLKRALAILRRTLGTTLE